MADKGEQSQVPDARDDSFDLLLKRVAHVSEPTSRFVPQLGVGHTLFGARLQIVRAIGEGAMGRVYEAYDRQRSGSVALKTLARLDAASVYLLKNEFRSLADVSHANLVRLHELFGEGEDWFFTMELVDGERFDDWVRPRSADFATGKLDEARLRAALTQLCEGIAAIHAAGKLHRDLKPSNVLVTREGRVVVLDFGLAVDPEPGGVGQTLRDAGVSGTPAYMAPEQAAGSPATTASDFYALGVMLFESLTGRLPFVGQSHEMLVDKQRGAAPGLKTTEALGDLAALCNALLARDPALRPDAETLRGALGPSRVSQVVPAGGNATSEGDVLLGRESELARLGDAYEVMRLGKSVVMFVSGESGIGKSTLCNAFLDQLRVRGQAVVLTGRCHERESVPFKGFDSLIDDLSRHLRRLSGQEGAALLPREVYALARIFPVLERVAVVAEAPKKVISDPQDLKRRAFDAFSELLGRLRDRSPLVVFLDDAQWLDQDSTRLMEHLLVRPDPVPMLIVCAHRSEGVERNPLLQSVIKTAQESLTLEVRALTVGPMSPAALHDLAQRLLPQDADDAALAALVTEAQGSPFFAAELARAFALAPQSARTRLPSLTEALDLHLQALPADAQRLLALLALADWPLPPELVLETQRSTDGHALLDTLRRERLVRMSFDPQGARRVECYHDKIREQATAPLDALALRELSLALSQTLLAQPQVYADLLARTLVQAGLPEQAALHAACAAEQAQAALAFDRAATLYTEALAHGRFEPERERALRVSRADALAWAGQGERAAEAYLEAAEGADDEVARQLTYRAGEHYLWAGNLERGRALFGEALRRLGISFPQKLPAALASVTWSRARLRARGLAFHARAEVDPRMLRELEALESATRTLLRSDQLRGADFCARWVRRALDAGHAVQAARALAFEHIVLVLTAPHGPQIDAVQTLCQRLCAETNDELTQYQLVFARGLRNPIAEQALADMELNLELVTAYPNPGSAYDLAWNRIMRANILSRIGRFPEVTALALSQLASARQRGDRPGSVALAQLAAMGLLAADRPDQAAEILDQFYVPPGGREMTMQDAQYLGTRTAIDLYRGDARKGWYAYAAYRERFLASFQAKVMNPGWVEASAIRLASVAAAQTENAGERAHLQREAMRLARRMARKPLQARIRRERRIAYLRGDHDAIVASLREELAMEHLFPIDRQVLRRSLGEALGGEDGAALVTEADEFLRQCGVVDPARFATVL